MSDFKSTRAILNEVEQLFTREDDIRDVDDIHKMANEIEGYYQANVKNAKELIKRKLTPCLR